MEEPKLNKPLEKTYEPFLQELWEEYGFRGKPPFAESVAEKRLKEACDKYANFVDHNKKEIVGSSKALYGISKFSSSEADRRVIHNQIALMVVGEQRSGMDVGLAKNIGEFAYEYSRGYKSSEAEKYGK